MENKTFITADAERNIPVTEPERQYYFIEKAKEKLTKLKEEGKKRIYILRYNIRLSDECERFGKAGWYFGTDRICRRTG